jgi:hypothetical protein
MNIKVDNQYLDFDDDIEIERQVKLFESVSDTSGDFSYSFTLQATKRNRAIFELYSIDQADKIIYQIIPATIDSNGTQVYFGFIRVERDRDLEIDCSFFSGNNNWFNDLNFKLRDFDFSQYDKDINFTEIIASEGATTGMLFPVINTGALTTRSYVNWSIDDMHPFIYVKSVIQTLLNRVGIKLEGDILQDWRYNHLITSNNEEGTPKVEIEDRSTYVNRSTVQVIPGTTSPVVTFPNTTGDYYTGDLWNTGTNAFTADNRMYVDIELTADVTTDFDHASVQVKKNDSVAIITLGWGNAGNSESGEKSKSAYRVLLEDGDYLEVIANADVENADLNSATLRITPTRVYKAFTRFILPDVLAKDFVSSVIALFNGVCDFNQATRVLTVNLFKNIIRGQELDISQYVDQTSIENDYTELSDNYGLVNNFSYSDGTSEALDTYNKNNTIPFGAGQLNSGNELIEPSVDIIDSEFAAVIEDSKNPFKTFLPHLDWRTVSNDNINFEAVPGTSSGGSLIFTPSGFIVGDLVVGDLVEISNSSLLEYEGQWIVSAVTSTTVRVAGLTYQGDATVDIQKLKIEVNTDSSQVLLLAVPNIAINDFTNNTLMFYADSTGVNGASTPATSYFYKPLQGLDIDEYKESLSFGANEIIDAHQITMLESYWRDFHNILRDPVKTKCLAHLPKSVFDQMFSGPLRLKTKKFNSQFYCNRITGYKKSDQACELELIKL